MEQQDVKSKAVQFDADVKESTEIKNTNLKNSKKFKKGKFQDERPQIPEVSAERYYQTTELLDIGKGAQFSLRTLFPPVQEDEIKEKEKSSSKHFFFKEKESENLNIPETKGTDEPSGYWKNAGMWHEPVFFSGGDVRFKEAFDFINGVGKDKNNHDRDNWSLQREKLKHFYRNKMRRHQVWETENNLKSHKKRPAGDASDGSSFHFYAQEDQVERQRQMKPHRTFFK